MTTHLFDSNSPPFTQPQDWTFPVPIMYGPGRLCELGARCLKSGISRPLIVTDSGSQRLAFVDQLQQALTQAALSTSVFFFHLPHSSRCRYGDWGIFPMKQPGRSYTAQVVSSNFNLDHCKYSGRTTRTAFMFGCTYNKRCAFYWHFI